MLILKQQRRQQNILVIFVHVCTCRSRVCANFKPICGSFFCIIIVFLFHSINICESHHFIILSWEERFKKSLTVLFILQTFSVSHEIYFDFAVVCCLLFWRWQNIYIHEQKSLECDSHAITTHSVCKKTTNKSQPKSIAN